MSDVVTAPGQRQEKNIKCLKVCSAYDHQMLVAFLRESPRDILGIDKGMSSFVIWPQSFSTHLFLWPVFG